MRDGDTTEADGEVALPVSLDVSEPLEGLDPSGDAESRFYFVGMEMARALAAAHGAAYFDDLFTRPPTAFFTDYLALSARDRSLPQLSAATRATLEALPPTW